MKGFGMIELNKVGWLEKPVPTITAMDALVKPLAVSPCTSDVHTVWESSVPRKNLILGHEAIVEVVEVGALVKDFKPGDKCILPAITPYWEKVESQMGYHQHSGGMLMGCQYSNFRDGAFGEFFQVIQADGNLALLPEGVSLEDGVMVSDMVPTGFHGADNAEISYGETVAVIGIGPVGLMAVAGANLRGAARIFAVGSREICQKVSKLYGATDLINYKNGDVVGQIKDATHGKPVDKVIIAGGTLEAFEWAMKLVRPAGIISNVNYLATGEYIKINRVDWGLGMGHIKLTGGLMPGGRKNMEYLANLLAYKKLDVNPLITHRFQGFDKIPDALMLMKDKPRDLIKPVVII
ncbi:MAG: NAD(P)-dependent alcohol dehydrogenase [Deltaproteobacteria bacterium]|jgi:threonine dehydrogenase-like Zn-dependent dehydrogenase|nr:NAD(P)-dependent alcohol dehydrogenase [Deltaproteobacteria bacterium]